MSGEVWLGTIDVPSRQFRHMFGRVERPARLADGVVTAYNDGVVTLRSNRRTEGYHESLNHEGHRGVRRGDLVVHGLDLVHGSVGVSESDGIISPVCIVSRAREGVDARFGAYALRVMAQSGYVRASARGIRSAGADFRRWATLAELRLPCPERSIQSATADFLDRESGRVRRLEDALAGFSRLIAASAAEAFDRRTAKLNSAPTRLRFVLLGIEQGWSPECDDRLAELGGWGVLKTGCVNYGYFRASEHKALPETLEPNELVEARPGDVLMSRANTRELVGSTAIVDETAGRRLMLSDKHYRLLLDPKKIRRGYAVDALRSASVRHQIEMATSGASASMQNISQVLIKGLRIPLIPLDKQLEVEDSLAEERDRLQQGLRAIEDMSRRLEEYRDSLITEAVTGQLDVTNASEPQMDERAHAALEGEFEAVA